MSMVGGVLERLDALPTPSPLALRLLAAANDDGTSARDLVEIIRQDSALTGRVLSLCRRGPRGRQLDVASLDRAVVLLGFAAVRAAALSVEFVAALGDAGETAARGFDACRFWRHSLAKAIVAEAAARHVKGGDAGRAFVAGLLHDIGALALARAMPALFDRACEEAERSGVPLDRAAESVLGIGCAEAGSRLAVRWNLPQELQEMLRLRGVDALAIDGPHRVTILLADVADRIVRRRHLGGDGFGPLGCDRGHPVDSPDAILAALGVAASSLEPHLDGLFAEVAARGESLGISNATSAAISADAIARANRRLEALRLAGADPRPGSDPIDELDAAGDPVATLSAIARAVARLSGRRGPKDRLLVVGAGADGLKPEIREFDADGTLVAGRIAGDGDVEGALAARRWCAMRSKAERSKTDSPGSLALACRGRTIATLYRAEGEVLPSAALARAPVSLWSFALAASLDRQQAVRAADRAAEAMRALALARDRLVRDRALASVGEIAAGLAHEINNPLTVVSGRAQSLRRGVRLEDVAALDQIVSAAEKASALVTQLLRTVRPSHPSIRECDASEIIDRALRTLRLTGRTGEGERAGEVAAIGGVAQANRQHSRIAVRTSVPNGTSESARVACLADPAHVADALAEVLQNALDAAAEGCVEVSAQIEGRDGRCMIRVRDVGPGFSDRALRHATDPFFSERSAGRGAGLGLAKARSIVESCGGSLELSNAAEGGAIVTIALPASATQPRVESRGDELRRAGCGRREAA
jgi:signal transduction histidine kinase/HD-like signal output (HDOD) protein